MCPEASQLLDFAVGDVASEQTWQTISDHLAGCTDCQSRLETVEDPQEGFLSELRLSLSPIEFEDEPSCSNALADVKALSETPYFKSAEALSDESLIGRTLGKYRILSQLGKGGMGVVYLANNCELDRLAAIKVLSSKYAGDTRAAKRFSLEMKALAKLDHPNVICAYHADVDDGKPYLVTKYIEGIDLSDLVSVAAPLAVADASELIRQAAAGLAHAHENGFVHRDIKPSNLILASDGTVKVLDMGLALLLAAHDDEDRLTSTGFALGTIDYMAPEQVTDSHHVDLRADIYSLGATFYKLLTNSVLHPAASRVPTKQRLLTILTGTPRSITSLRADLPEGLCRVIERMLANQVEDRFRDMNQVSEALQPFAAGAQLRELLAQGLRAKEAKEATPAADVVPASNVRPAADVALAAAEVVDDFKPAGSFHRLALRRSLKGFSLPFSTAHLALAMVFGTVLIIALMLRGGTPSVVPEPKQEKQEPHEATENYLARANLPPVVRDAMLTVVRQHPADSRWCGQVGSIVFGIAAKPLPGGENRQRTVPTFLELTHLTATQEMLRAKSLLDHYAAAGLTDATALRQAVVEAAGKLEVGGRAIGAVFQSAVQGDYAIAYITAEEPMLSARLLDPLELETVKVAYRETMHQQARDLMKRAAWKDALLVWQHLHQRKLVSEVLYLDAATCFKESGQHDDAVRLISEALDTFERGASAEFFEKAGDIASAMESASAEAVAVRAYETASDRLKSVTSEVQDRTAQPPVKNSPESPNP